MGLSFMYGNIEQEGSERFMGHSSMHGGIEHEAAYEVICDLLLWC